MMGVIIKFGIETLGSKLESRGEEETVVDIASFLRGNVYKVSFSGPHRDLLPSSSSQPVQETTSPREYFPPSPCRQVYNISTLL
jgi:hypothetical protein